jgi:hypothetical protein
MNLAARFAQRNMVVSGPSRFIVATATRSLLVATEQWALQGPRSLTHGLHGSRPYR